MAKKNLLLKNLNDSLLKLKALIGYNVVINYYMDETDLMMLIAFHKIDRYKEWKPLSVQFIKSDYDEDASVLNTKIAGLVKLYMENRLKVETHNTELKDYNERIDAAVKKFKIVNGLFANYIIMGADVLKIYDTDGGLVNYQLMRVIKDPKALPKTIKVGYDKKYAKRSKNGKK